MRRSQRTPAHHGRRGERFPQTVLSDEDLALETYREICAPWGQNIPPNRNCVAGHGLRDDQNGRFNRLQWLNGGRLGEMGKSLRSSHHRADMHFRADA